MRTVTPIPSMGIDPHNMGVRRISWGNMTDINFVIPIIPVIVIIIIIILIVVFVIVSPLIFIIPIIILIVLIILTILIVVPIFASSLIFIISFLPVILVVVGPCQYCDASVAHLGNSRRCAPNDGSS